MGLFVLAASCITIWEAARLSVIDASHDGEFRPEQLRLLATTNNSPGYHGLGALYENERPMDCKQAATRFLRSPCRIVV